MSWTHYQYAKEIERVLRISTGLTKAVLYDTIDVPDKNEREFGTVLAEMCQGVVPQVTTTHPPGMRTVYYHNAMAPTVTMPKPTAPGIRHPIPAAAREAIAPARLVDVPETPQAAPAMMPVQRDGKIKIKKCPGCGHDFEYIARGRPPILCSDCKIRAIPRCHACGQPLPRAKPAKPPETV